MIPVFAPKFCMAGVIAGLFSASEPGAWYDPSDMSTLFQDSAGTVPVTDVEQPVGRILDKSGRGNHAFQATATSRPVLQQDASGRYYLSFDGVDDWMKTNSIDFTATDKMTVFAGVRNLASGNNQILAELSTSATTNNGSFSVWAPIPFTNASYAYVSKGTTDAAASAAANLYPAPTSNVFTGHGDIAGDLVRLRINGSQISQNTGDQGAGNYGNYPLFIGRRGGQTNPFNGRIYSLIIRGAQSTEQQIASAEAWVNTKTGAY